MFLSFLFAVSAKAQCTLGLTLQDSIGVATYDILKRASEEAVEKKCSSIFIRLNTPGGHLQSTRLITEHILASPIPFLCLISPSGGHAGSAGAIILQACHVAGGLTATNVGAATPILGSGEEMGKDLRNKMINDTVSWVQGLAQLRGRSSEFARKIVTEGLAVTTDEAVRMKALDLSVDNEKEFLDRAVGREYVDGEKNKKKVEIGPLEEKKLDVRYQILQFISEPEWAYILFLGALLLLYAEFSHPGLILPGVTGSILLILSLIAFHKLEANYGGLALMILGLAFWIAELFITSKGILGIAGTVAFLIGSFLLFDRQNPDLHIPLRLILTAVLIFGGLSAGITFLAAKTLRKPKYDIDHQMQTAHVKLLEVSPDGHSGKLETLGEIWNFESQDILRPQDTVEITERENLTVWVRKKV